MGGFWVALMFFALSYYRNAGLPELSSERCLQWLRDKLFLDAQSEEVAAAHFRRLIAVALGTRATLFNDACHLLKHG